MKRNNLKGASLISLFLILCLIIGIMPLTTRAAVITTAPAQTSNLPNYRYIYNRWARPIRSYLSENPDGTYTRVEYTGEAVAVEIYDENRNFVSGSVLEMELPVFGGFYYGSDSNFLVFGQKNDEEDDDREVIRVVRYTKDWQRVASASLSGANTVEPFCAASLRFAEYNGYLYIRTGHGMYATEDGVNHQANLTLNVRIDDMVITESLDYADNSSSGYVSHSFNQFITVSNGRLYAVDHGDAYPRAVVLFRYHAPAGQDSFLEKKQVSAGGNAYVSMYAERINVLQIIGESGDNDTGVALGGFEVSDSHCLIVGNTVAQDDTYDPDGQRNIFISATSVEDFTADGTTIRYLTDYSAGDNVSISMPHFVKVDSNRYVVLWTENAGTLCWCFVDQTGAATGQVNRIPGAISDCKPIISQGKLIWYITSNSAPAFMVLDLNGSGDLEHQHVNSYSYEKSPGYTTEGKLTAACAVCAEPAESVVIPAIAGSDEYVLASVITAPTCTDEGFGFYKWVKLENYNVEQYNFGGKIPATGHIYEVVTVDATCTQDGSRTYTCTACGHVDVTVIPASGHYSSDSTVVPPTCTEDGTGGFTCEHCGVYVEVSQPALGHSYEVTQVVPATCAQQGYTEYTCSVCGDVSQGNLTEALPHTYFTSSMLPSCLRSGYKKYKCQECGYSYQETLPPTGHSYETIVTPPTCTEEGYTTYHCVKCTKGDYVDDQVPATGHTETVVTVDATCTTDGSITYTCQDCGNVRMETIASAGHKEVTDAAVDATCTASGLTEGTHCSVCNEVLMAQEEIPATGHTETVVTVDATCTTDGSITYTCQDCGNVRMETIASAGHKEVTDAAVDATCTASGLTEGTHCSVCNEVLTAQEEIPATGHTETVVTVDATCTADGSVTYTCQDCGNVRMETIASAGHKEVTDAAVDATCTASGLTEGTHCSVCNEVLMAQEEIPATGHRETVVTVDATCTTDGSITYTCQDCGNVRMETIASAGHKEVTDAAVDATCTASGLTEGTHCSVCNEVLTAQEEIPALGHRFTDGVCTVCGEADPDYVKPVVHPEITLKYPTLVFEDVILMNVYFSAENLEDVVEMGLITYREEPASWGVDNAEAVIPGYTWSKADGFYYATTGGIAAKDLGDEIYFAVYAKLSDGTYTYTRVVSYSPRKYAYSSLNTGSATMKPILVAMLNYGAAAQKFFNYKTDSLVNADLTAEQTGLVEDYRSDMIGAVTSVDAAKQGSLAATAGFARKYPTVSFEGAFCINYYCTPSVTPPDGVTMYYWNQEDYDSNEVLTLENATAAIPMTLEDGQYHAAVEGIAAKDISKGVYVCFVYTNNTDTCYSGVLSYSIGAYCAAQAKLSGASADLAKATAVYGYYANQLFN